MGDPELMERWIVVLLVAVFVAAVVVGFLFQRPEVSPPICAAC